MTTYCPQIGAASTISQCARSTKHLDNRDQDEDHKDNPHNPVATKKTIQEIHIANIYIPQIARRQVAHPLTLREDTKNMNNANKEQTIYGIIYLHPSHNQKKLTTFTLYFTKTI